MKVLLVLLALAAGLWLWRSGRRDAAKQQRAAPPTASDLPQPMVACLHCKVHLPRAEALPGTRGHYCCAAHRQQAEN